MKTFKYNGTDPIEIPSLGIGVREGETFEIPDEFAARFENDDLFSTSRVKNPDVTTGPIPVQGAPEQFPAQAAV